MLCYFLLVRKIIHLILFFKSIFVGCRSLDWQLFSLSIKNVILVMADLDDFSWEIGCLSPYSFEVNLSLSLFVLILLRRISRRYKESFSPTYLWFFSRIHNHNQQLWNQYHVPGSGLGILLQFSHLIYKETIYSCYC